MGGSTRVRGSSHWRRRLAQTRWRKTRASARDRTPPHSCHTSWPGSCVLYALQTLYSPDFSKSLQNVCFFFVPFSLVYALLRDVSWDKKLLKLVLVGGSRGGGGVRRCWLRGVLQPRPLLERPGDQVERIPHLLPGQLDLLGPEHLRALPGPGDRGGDVSAALGQGTPDAGVADRPGRCALARPCRRPSRSRASPPCWQD